ncbi:hypothetical protein [Chishuiella sp.]|uniref:hypothetical protein n=1 Tax=Chishuiella sp. TaxID=1969467 RepID=UPI0028A5ABD9|nr:hypothetical protein [Chishuiella sp.]
MSENNKKLKSLDEIVFEGRNKAYGAYDLRMSEKSTLLKAFIRGFVVIVILAFVVFASGTGLFSSKKNNDVVVDVQLEDLSLPEPPPEEEEVVEPEPEPEPEQQENHYQEETAQEKFVMPEPKEQPKKEETIPPKEELVGKDLSFEKREGKESTGQTGGGPVNLNKEAPKNTTQAPKTEDKGDAAPATVTARTAAVMAVYPGCEKDAAKGKQQATDCLSKKLGADIGDELQDFANDAAGEGLSGVVVAKLSFQIDTNGRIISISPMGDAKLGPEAKKALQRITDRQQKRGKTIKPAQTEDGRPAKLNFSIPVKMAIE